MGVLDEPLRDIELAVTEACAHVLDHPSRAESILVHTTVWPTRCELSVFDHGAAHHHDAPRGNGGPNRRQASVRLDLMEALVDEVDIRPTDAGGISVVLVKQLP
ncbi:MAG TPA: ATP-binding protein [Acidimicrobiales bacterium]|nr:ATP-binding protein [Acidimicrobiales bacterium]